MTTPAATRPVGRPRDPRCDTAILEAALDLLERVGYVALTMEAVAAQAGVGKATLYRRYASKDVLVVEALAGLHEPPGRVRLAGGVREDLVALVSAAQRRLSTSRSGRLLPRLVSAAVDQPGLLELYRDKVVAPRRARFAEVLQAGMAQGLLRPDLDVELTVDLLVGPVFYRALLQPHSRQLPAARLVDEVLRGLLTTPPPAVPPAASGRRPGSTAT